MRYEQTERLLRAARHLAARRTGVTLDELARAFEVDKRTAERMRDAIGVLFDLHLVGADPDGRKRWTVQGLDELDLRPNAEERAELALAAASLRSTGAPARAAVLEALADKLAAVTPAKAARRLAPDLEALAAGEAVAAGPRPDPGDALIADLRHALKAGTTVTFRHGGRRRRVAPFGVIFGARYYLVGAELKADRAAAAPLRPVLWRLDRLEALEPEGASFTRPEGFDLQAWAAEAFDVYRSGAPERVTLRFTPAAAAVGEVDAGEELAPHPLDEGVQDDADVAGGRDHQRLRPAKQDPALRRAEGQLQARVGGMASVHERGHGQASSSTR